MKKRNKLALMLGMSLLFSMMPTGMLAYDIYYSDYTTEEDCNYHHHEDYARDYIENVNEYNEIEEIDGSEKFEDGFTELVDVATGAMVWVPTTFFWVSCELDFLYAIGLANSPEFYGRVSEIIILDDLILPRTAAIVNRNVRFHGNGNMIKNPNGNTITVNGGSLTLNDTEIGGGGNGVVVTNGGYLEINDSKIVNNAYYGILANNSRVVVFDGIFEGNGTDGLRGTQQSEVTIYNGEFLDNDRHGVSASNNTTLTIASSGGEVLISNNGEHGIYAFASDIVVYDIIIEYSGLDAVNFHPGVSSFTMYNGIIRNNDEFGIRTQGQTVITIHDGLIKGNGIDGVRAIHQAEVVIYNGKFLDNGRHGVSVSNNTPLTIASSGGEVLISNNDEHGIYAFASDIVVYDIIIEYSGLDAVNFHPGVSSFTMYNGIIRNNDEFGIRTQGQTVITIHDGLIKGNGIDGVRAIHQAELFIDNGEIIENGRYGVSVSNNTSLTIARHGGDVLIADNGDHGIFSFASYIVVYDVIIERNGTDGINFHTHIAPFIMHNGIIRDNEEFGIRSQGMTVITIHDGLIEGNGMDGVRGANQSVITIYGGRIANNERYGVSFSVNSTLNNIGGIIENNDIEQIRNASAIQPYHTTERLLAI